ncbi:hypothetical protein V3C99_001613 [Haemonchus contortus]|nr:UBX domain containing protein [Haemonchus contortus]
MKWFAGSVSTAVQVSRKNNALLIVFIESKNGKGEKMRELWEMIEPSLFECPFVGIHLMEGDEAAKQFAQIYPTPVLPASYFIDNLGKPIEVITLLKDLDYDEFFLKISNSVKAFTAAIKSPPSENSVDQQSVAAPSHEMTPTSSSPPPSSAALEEKIQRAKMLLEQKKKADEEAKREEEKRRELERINTGKLMQEAQQKRHEQELLEAAAQRRRDKIEAEKERKRLIAQIKADREEREFRERRGRPMKSSAEEVQAQPEAPKMEPIPTDRCRVQVRLPDGDNIVEEFASSDCLGTLVDLIRQDGRVSGAFSIAQVYPRKVFTDDDLQKTFLDLCLTPSCTLLIIQTKGRSSQIMSANPLRGVLSLFSMLVLAPVQYIYNLVTGWLGWSSGSRASDRVRQDEVKRPREARATGATIRRRGNTGRLHNTNDDSDDDNANWNGNSTQFL